MYRILLIAVPSFLRAAPPLEDSGFFVIFLVIPALAIAAVTIGLLAYFSSPRRNPVRDGGESTGPSGSKGPDHPNDPGDDGQDDGPYPLVPRPPTTRPPALRMREKLPV